MYLKKQLFLIAALIITLHATSLALNVDSLKNLLLKAQETKNYARQSNIYIQLADHYFSISNIDSSELFYLKALDLAKKYNLNRQKVTSKNGLGAVSYRKGDYPGALKWYFSALEDFQSYKNDTLQAATYNKMAGVFYKLREYKKTLDYLNKSLDLKLKIGDSIAISQTYNNLGNIYAEMGKLDSALYFYFKDLEISEKHNNFYNLAISYTNIASIYREKGQYKKALKYAYKALAIDTTVHDLYGIAADYNEIALAYEGLKDYDKAAYYFEKSIEIAKQINAKELVVSFTKDLSDFYQKTGDYRRALDLYKQYSAYKDTLLNEAKNRQIIEAEKKYETEKKNAQIQTLKYQKQRAQTMQKVFFITSGLLLIIALLVVRMFSIKVKANKKLNEKNEQLRQMNETQNRLMSIISHDLKAPLAAFYSITTSLRNKFDKLSNDEIHAYFDRMLNSAIALKLQLENLLNWSITQQREISVNKSKFNLPVLVAKVVMILQEFANEKNVTIENKITDDIEIETDGRLLNIALNNIISNAIKYSPPNSQVIISHTQMPGKIIISVKDFGIGMSNEEIEKIFSGKNVPRTENSGTGLGLIVTRDIIDKLGGQIKAISQKGQGTEIIIELPA